MINELIDQIGGRGRLEKLVAQYDEECYCDVKDDEVITALRALLTVMDAYEKPFMYAIADCDGNAHFDDVCVDSDGGLLAGVVDYLNELREEGDVGYSVVPLYTIPPAASMPHVSFDPAKPGAETTVITHYSTPQQ
ncbi:hypothetical protein [Erwinia sorbitola]|uniref:Uncharacterized protein n=1 Tax=Erwinia sorbitola TaxID=2681984 RepID=A0A6I6ER85_9GAMM|nr:hypothetical protein [Erwinia sorbitola]QGU87042.1 hypothetical protein GN242_07345 [Erwinia sorbitola]